MLYPQTPHPPLMIAERLSAQANLGYVPLVDEAARAQYGLTCAEMIASYLVAPRGARLVDPCAGEGRAAADIAARLGVHRKALYLNELHDGRATACKAVSDHVLACDTLKSLQASPGMFTFAYLNPPFGNDGAEEGGGRLEPKFFRRVVEEGRWVAGGGAVVIVTPQDILQRQESLNFLARCLDVRHLAVLPEPIRAYREAIVFAVVREKFRSMSRGRSSMDAYARRHPLSRSARRCTQARAALQASLACTYPRRPDRRPPNHRAERAHLRARVTSLGAGGRPPAAP